MTAARADIADILLAGHVFAARYAAPQICGCAAAGTMIRNDASADAVAVSELLHGEAFAVIDLTDDWAWGYSVHDGYVGYVQRSALGAHSIATHVVIGRGAPLFAAPDIKSKVRMLLSMGASLTGEVTGEFLSTSAGFVHLRHVAPVAERQEDPVAIAETLIGTPYVWGGRSGMGIDCSGLVQLSLGLCGIQAPRDSDQQRAALGVPLADDEAARRGDMIFFPGHVGFMADETQLIHANAHAMAVTVEPLADVVARLAPAHPSPIIARRRLA